MFEVKIYVENEKELYNSFDKEKTTLNSDLTSYIRECMSERKIGEKIALTITSPAKIDENKFRVAADKFIIKQKRSLNKEAKAYSLQSIMLLIVGIAFVVLGIVLGNSINIVIATIISTIGSFSIWEAANRWLIELPRIRTIKKITTFLSDIDINIVKI